MIVPRSPQVTPLPSAEGRDAPESPRSPAIEVRNLHFHYDATDGQLHDISLAIEEGECVGLIGPNGAGKSTLLLHFNGVLPDSFDGPASVLVFGEPVGPRTLYAIRRQVGLLFQDPDDQLFCPTVYEDVAFGPKQFGWPPERIAAAVQQSLAHVGMTASEKKNPHHLSGGEKRRACLAGILACEPRILVLDEPTTGLDPRGRRELISLLSKIPATKVIATHDLDMVAELCSQVIVLDGGQIVARGPARALLGNERLMFKHGLESPRGLSGG